METKQVIEDKVIKKIEELRKEKNPNFTSIPDFRPGDTINVAVRVVEGEKERIQNFKGIVFSRRGSGINQTFTVRKISNYIGVERIFPLYSPIIQNIELVSKGNVRRSKIYFIRGLNEKKIRQKLR